MDSIKSEGAGHSQFSGARAKLDKYDPLSEMTKEERQEYKKAVDSGAIIPYDNRPAIKMLEDLFNAYITIPQEALDNAMVNPGKFKDAAFDKIWADTLDLATKDPHARAMLYKAIKSSPDLSGDFDKLAKESNWQLDTDDQEFNNEMDDDTYEFIWQDVDTDENDRMWEESKQDLKKQLDEMEGPTDEELNAIEKEEKEDDASKESWSNITGALKNRHF